MNRDKIIQGSLLFGGAVVGVILTHFIPASSPYVAVSLAAFGRWISTLSNNSNAERVGDGNGGVEQGNRGDVLVAVEHHNEDAAVERVGDSHGERVNDVHNIIETVIRQGEREEDGVAVEHHHEHNGHAGRVNYSHVTVVVEQGGMVVVEQEGREGVVVVEDHHHHEAVEMVSDGPLKDVEVVENYHPADEAKDARDNRATECTVSCATSVAAEYDEDEYSDVGEVEYEDRSSSTEVVATDSPRITYSDSLQSDENDTNDTRDSTEHSENFHHEFVQPMGESLDCE